MRIVSVGEILWDIFPDAEHLGGAPFNFAVHAHRLGQDVQLVSAVGDDERGRRALAEMRRIGLATDFVRCVPQPTGTVGIDFDPAGEPDYTIQRPAAYDFLGIDPRLIEFRPGWIYFGTLAHTEARAAAAIDEILRTIPAKRFYDVNLRRDSYTPELVERLAREADVLKLNEGELETLGWTIEEIPAAIKCVTRGERGCTVIIGDDRAECPGYHVRVADRVGAGDAFSAALLDAIGKGWSAGRAGDFANRLAALVVSRPGAIPEWSPAEIRTIEN